MLKERQPTPGKIGGSYLLSLSRQNGTLLMSLLSLVGGAVEHRGPVLSYAQTTI